MTTGIKCQQTIVKLLCLIASQEELSCDLKMTTNLITIGLAQNKKPIYKKLRIADV